MKTGWRLFWLGALAAHGFAAVAWWWLMPGGFAMSQMRFWVNEVLPWCVLGLALGTRFLWWKRERARDLSLASFGVFWITAAIAARVVFPVSAGWLFAIPLAGGVVMAGSMWRGWRNIKGPRCWLLVLPMVMGMAMPLAQRAPEPDTKPWSMRLFEPAVSTEGERPSRTMVLSPDVRIDPSEPVATLTAGRVTLGVQPRLTFVSRSPDRCWTLFAPRELREGPRTRLAFARNSGGKIQLVHVDDTMSMLEGWLDEMTLHLDSQTHLSKPIYSHLNTFTELTISGHRKLSVAFSPCPRERIDFTPFQIRGDDPGRSAHLAADGMFRVVQARRAEKGPFTTLAEGKLARDQALTMTFYDEDVPLFEVTLLDWAAQAGTQISPTAGYGLPVNAIEFSLDGATERSAAGMWITLGATSVGRGWDSVGHSAGTYRNRIAARIIMRGTVE